MGAMRLLVVEDDPLFADNLCSVLAAEPEIVVTGVFASAEEALAAMAECSPDLLLTDIGLPGMSGTELIRRAKEILPGLEIMVLTVFDDRDTIFAALKAGASGYILKSSMPRDLVEDLLDLHRGGSPMSPRIARKIIKEFQSEAVSEQYVLSYREKEIIREIEAGRAYKEISQKFSISTHTVHAHIRNIYKKLHASNKQAALSTARRKGII